MNVAFEALWDALAQYVQNTEDIEDELDERERKKLVAARAMLTRMDLAAAGGTMALVKGTPWT